jgi:ribosomal protein S18 acetylase RimI-like enzyme
VGVVAIDAAALQALIATSSLNQTASIRLRAETNADLDFSAGLYAQTREAELRQVAWPHEARLSFCREQFNAQHAHYEKHYPRAQFLIVELADQAIGRVYFEQTASELRLMEITIDAAHRNRGIGSAISAALLVHARAQGIAMGLHVEPFNPARRLYERQGFSIIEERGIYLYMRVEPPTAS